MSTSKSLLCLLSITILGACSDDIDGRATNEDLRLTELPSGQISTSGEVILCFNEGERQFLAHEDGVFLLESL